MAYKKDSVFYIKSLCEKSGARYDIENGRFIPEYEDRAMLINRGMELSMRAFARLLYESGKMEEAINKASANIHQKLKTKYKTQRKETTRWTNLQN